MSELFHSPTLPPPSSRSWRSIWCWPATMPSSSALPQPACRPNAGHGDPCRHHRSDRAAPRFRGGGGSSCWRLSACCSPAAFCCYGCAGRCGANCAGPAHTIPKRHLGRTMTHAPPQDLRASRLADRASRTFRCRSTTCWRWRAPRASIRRRWSSVSACRSS